MFHFFDCDDLNVAPKSEKKEDLKTPAVQPQALA